VRKEGKSGAAVTKAATASGHSARGGRFRNHWEVDSRREPYTLQLQSTPIWNTHTTQMGGGTGDKLGYRTKNKMPHHDQKDATFGKVLSRRVMIRNRHQKGGIKLLGKNK